MMGLLYSAALTVLLYGSAFAQTVDWCASPLSAEADADTALVWRLHCTVQILVQERAEAIDRATAAELDKAEAEARLREKSK